MKILKRIILPLIAVFITIQFFRPEKNISAAPQANHISGKFRMPDDLSQILSESCYDCHSNNTRYPWYNHIQPLTWWLNDHVTEGKKHLNFDIYTSYNLRRQYHKFEEIVEMVKDDEMPLSSYVFGHPGAALTPEEKSKIIAWCNFNMDEMKSIYPADSLKRK